MTLRASQDEGRSGDRRSLTLLATMIAVGTSAMVIFSMLVWLARALEPLPVSFGRTAIGVAGLIVAPISYAAVGAILASRIQRNPIGWLFLAAGFALGTMLPVNLLVASAHETLRPASSLVIAIAWLRNTFATPAVVTALIMAAAVFPTGRPLASRWASGIWLTLLGGALLATAAAADPAGMLSYPSIPNPTAMASDLAPLASGTRLVAVGVLVVSAGLAIGALLIRYRGGDDFQRAQLRWILLAALITAVAGIPFLLSRYLDVVPETTGELLAAASQLGSVALPIATAIAISRYRLFDIDVLLGRTLVYLPLMAILAGVYTASIAFFQRLFVEMTGETSDTATILTVLVVAAAFTPVRRALEGIIERRFPLAGDGKGSPDPEASALEASAPPSGTGGVPDGGTADRPLEASRLLPIGLDDTVECGLGGRVRLAACLRCPHLRAFVRDPEPAVVCAASASAAGA